MRKINVKIAFSIMTIFEHEKLQTFDIKLILCSNYLEPVNNTCNLGHLANQVGTK